MPWPTSLQVALKEWASVCSALEDGRQIILLRKGGISDIGGEFHVEHRQFLLFPTYLHQNRNMLKPAAHAALDASRDAEPTEIVIRSAGVVTDIVPVASRAQMDRLDAAHVWASPLIDMRFNYKPEKPLYLLLVRAYRLQQPTTITNTPAYAGCKSWVPLDGEIPTGDATPALEDVRYEHRRRAILDPLASTS